MIAEVEFTAQQLAFLPIFAVVVAAALWDLRSGRIPNWLTYTALGAGLLMGLWSAIGPGPWACCVGLLVGALPGIALFLLGSIGGGDVKLMAALGTMLGFPFIVDLWMVSILVGAALGIGVVLWHGRVGEILRGLGWTLASLLYPGIRAVVPARDLKVRFALPIAVATCLVLLFPLFRPFSRAFPNLV